MYCVYDNKKNVIAFHDDLDVVETYVQRVNQSHIVNDDGASELHIGKIKKKKLKSIVDLDDLYLVRYADTYVQTGYLVYLELLSDQHIYDEKHCKEIILRMLECYDITDKERKAMEKTVETIDRFLQESKTFTPSISELKMYEMDYAPYLYNKGIFIN